MHPGHITLHAIIMSNFYHKRRSITFIIKQIYILTNVNKHMATRMLVILGRSGLVLGLGRVTSLALVGDVGHEAGVPVHSVADDLDAAVGQEDLVLAGGGLAVPLLLGVVVVAGVVVLDLVGVLVLRGVGGLGLVGGGGWGVTAGRLVGGDAGGEEGEGGEEGLRVGR